MPKNRLSPKTRAPARVKTRRTIAVVSKRGAAPKVGVVVAEFHAELAQAMLAAARAEAEALDVTLAAPIFIPGCYEAPLVAERLLARRDLAAVVVLGYIERGETLHGEVMGHVVHRALVEASLRARKPVGLGIIGPGATRKQAEVRKDPSARAAVRAVVRSLAALTEADA